MPGIGINERAGDRGDYAYRHRISDRRERRDAHGALGRFAGIVELLQQVIPIRATLAQGDLAIDEVAGLGLAEIGAARAAGAEGRIAIAAGLAEGVRTAAGGGVAKGAGL